jgi:uncharacterized protein YbdZ (MbtH family)
MRATYIKGSSLWRKGFNTISKGWESCSRNLSREESSKYFNSQEMRLREKGSH